MKMKIATSIWRWMDVLNTIFQEGELIKHH